MKKKTVFFWLLFVVALCFPIDASASAPCKLWLQKGWFSWLTKDAIAWEQYPFQRNYVGQKVQVRNLYQNLGLVDGAGNGFWINLPLVRRTLWGLDNAVGSLFVGSYQLNGAVKVVLHSAESGKRTVFYDVYHWTSGHERGEPPTPLTGTVLIQNEEYLLLQESAREYTLVRTKGWAIESDSQIFRDGRDLHTDVDPSTFIRVLDDSRLDPEEVQARLAGIRVSRKN